MAIINLDQLRSENYYENESKSCNPCIICGKDVSKIEEQFDEKWDDICNKDKKALQWYKNNFIHMDTSGNLYYTDEDVAEGEESQGCFPIGCVCMKKYKQLRMTLK